MYIDTTPDNAIWFVDDGRIIFILKLAEGGQVALITSGDAYCHDKYKEETDPIMCPGWAPSGEGSRHVNPLYRETLWPPDEDLVVFESRFDAGVIVATKLLRNYYETKLFEVKPYKNGTFLVTTFTKNGFSDKHVLYEVQGDKVPRGLFLEE